MAASKEDYLQIVTAEETEIFIISLVEHVVQKSQEVLFEKHIESQVLPYAVQFAKGALDELVEWEFFRQDDGAIDPETWEPDEEPEPALTDSWSPGMIPFRKAVTAPATTSVPTPPILSTSTSGISVVSSEYQEEKQTPIGQRRPSTIGIRASANSLASTSKKYNTSRMELASAASLTTSSASLRQKRFSSVGSAGRRAGAGKDNSAPVPLSAVQIAEQAIQEENKRTLARLRSQEKESSKPIEWSYDHNGRVVVVKKTAIAKQITQGIKAKILPTPEAPSPPSKGHGAVPAAAETTQKQEHRSRKPRRAGASKITAAALKPSAPFGVPHRPAPPRDEHPTAKAGSISSLHEMRPSVTNRARHPLRKEHKIRGSGMSLSDTTFETTSGFVEDLSLEVPSLAETMKLAAGVTLRENDTIKRGAPVSSIPNAHPKHLPTTHPGSLIPRSDPLATVLSHARPVIRRVEPLPGIGETRPIEVIEKRDLETRVA